MSKFLGLCCLVFSFNSFALTQEKVLCEGTDPQLLMIAKEVVASATVTSSAIVASTQNPKYTVVQYIEFSIGDVVCRFNIVNVPEVVISIQEDSVKEKILKASNNFIFKIKEMIGK
jgi:hypothetical protein